MKIPEGMDATRLAKRALRIAYDASEVIGMGIFQARDNVTEDELWSQCRARQEGIKTVLYGDYVFGRMMKIQIEWIDDEIWSHGHTQLDYQSWSASFPTYNKLFEEAVLSLMIEDEENV